MKRLFIGLSIFIVVLLIAGTIYQTAASEADKRNFPPPGNLIDVDGYEMHIYSKGAKTSAELFSSKIDGINQSVRIVPTQLTSIYYPLLIG